MTNNIEIIVDNYISEKLTAKISEDKVRRLKKRIVNAYNGLVTDIEHEAEKLKIRNNLVPLLQLRQAFNLLKNDSDIAELCDEGKISEEFRDHLFEIISGDLPNYTVEAKGFTPEQTTTSWVTEELKNKRYYWNLLKKKFARDGKSRATITSIDQQSETVLQYLHNPADNSNWQCYGLVIGQVQSGKTTNYSSVIAKAADAGYKIIVVLAGLHNDLRNQTQVRLDEDFIGSTYKSPEGEFQLPKPKPVGVGNITGFDGCKSPQSGTKYGDDFRNPGCKTEELPWLLVVKKNVSVLGNLIRWAENLPDKPSRPLLVIDDESDQASVNTSKNNFSAINRHIRDLLKQFPRASYVGYTATPFANFFIDATEDNEKHGQDLYPRAFITQLDANPHYYGPEDFFGEGFNGSMPTYMTFGTTSANEWVKKLRKYKKAKCRSISTSMTQEEASILPDEARKAIQQYILSTAIRWWRSEVGKEHDQKSNPVESSMLIHVTHLVAEQGLVKDGVENYLDELKSIVDFGDDAEFLDLFKPLWENQPAITNEIREYRGKKTHALPDIPDNWVLPASLEDIGEKLHDVLFGTSIYLINGESQNKPAYVGEYLEEVRSRIYIGGNKLSRGLTLPGLCVSVFLRGTNTYDTLLQMGRWFGYRDGYADLCRISTTRGLVEKFRNLVMVTKDVDNQIKLMERDKRTPMNYRLIIQSHPGMSITQASKMRTAVPSRSYFNGIRETREIEFTNADRYRTHCVAPVEKLFEELTEDRLVYADNTFTDFYGKRTQSLNNHAGNNGKHDMRPDGRLWKNIPAKAIAEFVSTFNNPKPSDKKYGEYIRNHAANGNITNWTVFVPARFAEDGFKNCQCVVRKFEYSNDGVAHLRALKTADHEYVGVGEEVINKALRLIESSKSDDTVLYTAVRHCAGEIEPQTAHLILYPITPIAADNQALECDGLPLFGWYAWVPKFKDETDARIGIGNMTITIDEEFGEEPVNEDD